jgi:integrase
MANKLRDKTYRVRYDVLPTDGKRRDRRTETLENTTKREAEAYEALKRVELVAARKAQATGETPKELVTLESLFKAFLDAKASSAEATTVQRYAAICKVYLSHFGKMRAQDLRPVHLTKKYAEFRAHGASGKPISGGTLHHIHATFKSILNWASKRGLVARSVADVAWAVSDDLPKRNDPELPALSTDELEAVLAEAKNPTPTTNGRKRAYYPWLYAAMETSASTGARRGEVLALRWSDVDWTSEELTIARSVTEWRTFKKPKSGKTREVHLDDELREVLEAHRAAQDAEKEAMGTAYVDQDLVFAGPDGSTLDPAWFGDAAQRCIDRAGVRRITLHGLRRTLATLALEGGADVHLISKQLGHSDVRTTERYLHIRPTRNAEVSAAFRRMRRNGRPSSGIDLGEREVGEAETLMK